VDDPLFTDWLTWFAVAAGLARGQQFLTHNGTGLRREGDKVTRFCLKSLRKNPRNKLNCRIFRKAIAVLENQIRPHSFVKCPAEFPKVSKDNF
jgi:hypothetical protein